MKMYDSKRASGGTPVLTAEDRKASPVVPEETDEDKPAALLSSMLQDERKIKSELMASRKPVVVTSWVW
jgi:hypothetical protein